MTRLVIEDESERTIRCLRELRDGMIPNDDDLRFVRDFLEVAENHLRVMGPHFHLAWKETLSDLKTANDFLWAREKP